MSLIKNWTWRESLLILILLFNIGAKFCTVFIVTNTAQLGSSASSLEANPVNRIIQELGYIQFLAQGVLYAAIITLYWYLKKKYGKQSVALNLMLFIFFTLSLMDFMNDLSYVSVILFK